MVKIVIQSSTCETVINNIQPEDLEFWERMLNGALISGEARIIDLDTDKPQIA